jgi:hypothetical protein
MQIPDEHNFPDTGLTDEYRETTVIVICELIKTYNIPVDET